MLYAGLITPLTAIFGWLFWMKDDSAPDAIVRMTVVWRLVIGRRDRWPSFAYLVVDVLVVAAVIVQGTLGGDQTFSAM